MEIFRYKTIQDSIQLSNKISKEQNSEKLFSGHLHYKITGLPLLSIMTILLVVVLSSCSTLKYLNEQITESYPATIFFINGEKKSGLVDLPSAAVKLVKLVEHSGEEKQINSEEIKKIEYHPNEFPGKVYTASYLPFKKRLTGRVVNRWVMQMAKGPYITAYIGAKGYGINSDGSIKLIGERQVIQHNGGNMGNTVINPSFPIFIMKKGEDKLTIIAVKEGVNFESSSFRSGVSYYLSDDPQLCTYVRQEKLGVNDIDLIVENYKPNRGNEELTIGGVIIPLRKKRLFTNDLDNELFFSAEAAMHSGNRYGNQYCVGIRSFFNRFYTYGGNVGYASAQYVDAVRRIDNHGINDAEYARVIDEDIMEENLFRINTYVGAQLPFNFKNIYLIPAANITLGGMFGTEYAAVTCGAMTTLDVGFRMKRGGVVLLGGGYRHNIPLVSEDYKAEASAPGFDAYEPYGSLLFRLSYKF